MVKYGISGNLMSLGAVDFGLIIDGAVVMVENIVCQLAHRQAHAGRALTAHEREATVLAASQQVGRPMFFGVLIITLVYVPILALTGLEGKMFQPMALTVMLALGGALVLADAGAVFLRALGHCGGKGQSADPGGEGCLWACAGRGVAREMVGHFGSRRIVWSFRGGVF
jgi:hypothetical protein